MTQPLALILYENLLPGSKLVNRMQDLGYRIKTLSQANQLIPQAEQEKPLLVIAELTANPADICSAIRTLKTNPATEHIPVLAFSNQRNAKFLAEATAAGAKLVANSTALLDQLPHLLEQVLQVD